MAQAPTHVSSLNGVDVDQLFENVGKLKAQPDLGKFRFRARNKWVKGGHNHTTIRNFYGVGEEHADRPTFELDNDEPPVLLGEDNGPNPVEQVLHGLAGCLTTGFIYHAAAKGIEIQELESTLEGELDVRGFLGIAPDVRNGYERIRVHFKVKSNASDEQLQELGRIAQARSPVFDIVSHPTPVEVDVKRK